MKPGKNDGFFQDMDSSSPRGGCHRLLYQLARHKDAFQAVEARLYRQVQAAFHPRHPSEQRRRHRQVGERSPELLRPRFKSRLEEPSLRAKIEESIYIVIDTMLSSQASVLVKSFSGGARNSPASDRRGSLSDLGNLASLSLDAILRSPEFRQALSEAVARAAAEAGKVPVGALVSSKRLGELAGNFAESCGTDDMLSLSDAFIDKLAAGSGRGSAQLFSDNALSPLLDVAARSVYSSLLPVVETLLASGEVRASLETMAMDMVKTVGVGPLQRLIVSAANYEKTLAETMPDTISDVSEALMGLLRSPDMAQKATSSVIAYARASRVSRSDAGIVGASAEGYGWVVEPRDVREPDGLPENDGKPARNGDLIAGILPAEDLKKALRIFFSEIQGDRSGFAAGVEKRFLDIADKPIAELLPGIPELIAKSISENLGSSREEGQVSAQSGQGPAILAGSSSSWILLAHLEAGRRESRGAKKKRERSRILARGSAWVPPAISLSGTDIACRGKVTTDWPI